MTTPSIDAAQHFTVAQLVWPNGMIRAGRVHLEYFATDAAAVKMTIAYTPPGKAPRASTWLFARDLLTRVVADDTIAGDNDVIVARHDAELMRVCLHDSERDFTVDVLLPLLNVAKFIAETDRCCAHGSIDEATRISQQIDAALVEILRGTR